MKAAIMLTISRSGHRSIKHYTETADQAKCSATKHCAAGGGLAEYYSEDETRIPSWLVVGDKAAIAQSTGLGASALEGGDADITGALSGKVAIITVAGQGISRAQRYDGPTTVPISASSISTRTPLNRSPRSVCWDAPKLTTKQQTELRRMHGTGDYTITDLVALFNICRPTVYRTLAAVETVAAQRSRR
jgi:Helix-turn-helix domain of resolvase